jgi:hypothetical protein
MQAVGAKSGAVPSSLTTDRLNILRGRPNIERSLQICGRASAFSRPAPTPDKGIPTIILETSTSSQKREGIGELHSSLHL